MPRSKGRETPRIGVAAGRDRVIFGNESGQKARGKPETKDTEVPAKFAVRPNKMALESSAESVTPKTADELFCFFFSPV